MSDFRLTPLVGGTHITQFYRTLIDRIFTNLPIPLAWTLYGLAELSNMDVPWLSFLYCACFEKLAEG